jgi:hypothetical protein
MNKVQDYLNKNIENIASFEIKYCYWVIHYKDGTKVEMLEDDGEMYLELFDVDGKYIDFID